MTTTADYIASGFHKIDRDLAYLSECLREVLTDLGETTAASVLPWTKQSASPPSDITLPGIEQAYSIAFQLLNMVEENAALRTRRLREKEHGLNDEPGLWGANLKSLIKAGFREKEIADYLPKVRVEPVLTAHPTEAKRSAVLELHREIFRLLSELENPTLSPSDQAAIREDIKTVLECLWRTGEILVQKPDVASERRGIHYYLREIFPSSLEQLDDRLRQAWAVSGFDLRKLDNPLRLPRMRFGTWVGGDRDGHPFVTAEVTQETLLDLRLSAMVVMDRKLKHLASNLPLSGSFQHPPKAFVTVLNRLRHELGESAREIDLRYPDEPWRQYALLLRAKLPLEARPTDRARIKEQDIHYRHAEDLDEDLRTLSDSLCEIGASRLAEAVVAPVRRALSVFGFHLAALDIRQNSDFHDKAMTQILQASGYPNPDFAEWDEARRLEFLMKELQSPRPFLYHDTGIGVEADAVLSCYRILNKHIRHYGAKGIGSLVVSMTRRVSDLFLVYLFEREAGLMHWDGEKLYSEFPVVPLFETLDDLQRCPKLMDQFLSHSVTQASGDYQRRMRHPNERPVQQIMIGYSDSNKDCGILSSQWSLHQAQRKLVEVGEKHGTRIRFFHGRGGTISRGAGPTHRFLSALPPNSINGDLRLTEQGETIAQKYANLSNATYNLELLVAGVTGVSLLQTKNHTSDPELAPLCDRLSIVSTKAYQNLISAEDFMAFYSAATPIDALEFSRIGSRPSRRTGQRTLHDLRAIPWVFSWNQSRYYLPGWYGVGFALEECASKHPEDFAILKAQLKSMPFLYYVLTNVETNLASADLKLMEDYASLVEDPHIRDRFFSLIRDEFLRTHRMMSEVFGGSIEERRPRMLRTLKLRADVLLALHHKQIEALASWRKARKEDSPEAASLLPAVLLSINAIANGLRTTG